MKRLAGTAVLIFLLVVGCGKKGKEVQGFMFKDDLAFLRQHTQVIVLSDATGKTQVAVSPDLQGRIMTSTATGPEGLSFGWINRELISSGENNLHINAFGGEDRFWLGPEGGQFSIFFKNGDPFDLEHWFTPQPINEGAYEVVFQSNDGVHFRKAMQLVNYANSQFSLELNREVRLLDGERIAALGIFVPDDVKMAAFQSENKITNTGANVWVKETGLLSIWILGMFNPSPATTVVVPFISGSEAELGPTVNDAYFGKVPSDRLVIGEGVLYFKGDGQYRSKIGISAKRAKPFLGSYDAANGVLTIVHLTIPEGATDYVNSMWEIQENPFGGDVVNSYNDGPAAPGARPLGPFYELESSSPAAGLRPGETLSHVHTTMHFQGSEKALDRIAREALGVGISEIKGAFEAKPLTR